VTRPSAIRKIVTFTPNPAIDVATSVATMTAFSKLRCMPAHRDPGGGGINVARALKRLGGDVTAIYPAGGAAGQLLRQLVDRERIASLTIPVLEETREDITIIERSSGTQYRFVFPGSPLSEQEWRTCLDVLAKLSPPPDFVVASGSLPPGVPADLYARVARIAKHIGAKMVLDTSSTALTPALAEGVWLVKPNLGELSGFAGRPLLDEPSRVRAARDIIKSASAQVVALTLADEGALLVDSEQALRARPIPVEVSSAVGAGDSFLGGLVWALAEGMPMRKAFSYAVAAGSAAVLNTGTELCHQDDVHRLQREVIIEKVPESRAARRHAHASA
jgi:6-phosphofructokinase 2